jgi:hypothetical protein
MKYVNPRFTIPAPDKLNGLACPRCALGPKWGEHAPGCLHHNEHSTAAILSAIERVHNVRLEWAQIPSDCEFCRLDECRDFDAAGYLPAPDGRAICIRCLEIGRHMRPR